MQTPFIDVSNDAVLNLYSTPHLYGLCETSVKT